MNFVFLKFQYISKNLEKLVNELVTNYFIVVFPEFFKVTEVEISPPGRYSYLLQS